MGQNAEAETVLVAAVSGIEGEAVVNAGRRTTAIRRLIALFQGWGKPEKVAEWQAKLVPAK